MKTRIFFHFIQHPTFQDKAVGVTINRVDLKQKHGVHEVFDVRIANSHVGVYHSEDIEHHHGFPSFLGHGKAWYKSGQAIAKLNNLHLLIK